MHKAENIQIYGRRILSKIKLSVICLFFNHNVVFKQGDPCFHRSKNK